MHSKIFRYNFDITLTKRITFVEMAIDAGELNLVLLYTMLVIDTLQE